MSRKVYVFEVLVAGESEWGAVRAWLKLPTPEQINAECEIGQTLANTIGTLFGIEPPNFDYRITGYTPEGS